MTVRERFILTYAAMILGTGIFLGALQLLSLGLQFSLYVIEFLLLLEFLAHYRRSLSQTLGPVATVLLLAFIYVIAQSVIQILAPAP
jgi:hypothetical protein